MKPASRTANATGGVGVGVVVCVDVEAPARNGADRVAAFCKEAPERGGIVGAGHAAAHADDGDGFAHRPLGASEAGLRFLQRKEGALQRRQRGRVAGYLGDRMRGAHESPSRFSNRASTSSSLIAAT